jgi:arginine utilization protein RocB
MSEVISEVKTFIDEGGRRIMSLQPIDGSETVLKGIGGIRTPDGRVMQFEFHFAHNELRRAFEEFDERAKTAFEEIQKNMLEEQAKENKKIVVPNGSSVGGKPSINPLIFPSK